MPSIQLYFARVSRCTVDPLTNLFRRNIMLFNDIISNDIIQYNNTQEYIASLLNENIAFYNCIGLNIASSSLMSITYDSYIKHMLNFTNFSSSSITQLQQSQLYTYYTRSSRVFYSQVCYSNLFLPLTLTPLVSYLTLDKTLLLLPSMNIAGNITKKTDTQVTTFDTSSVQRISALLFMSGYKDFSISQVINYGGENTFYSLNGFFNYFRYKYTSLMPDKYTILIGTNKLNFYDQNMNCIETHYLGFKRFFVGNTFLKQSLYKSIFIDNTLYIYDTNTLKLYIYHIDSMTLESKLYFALNDSINPDEVSMFIDPTYRSPYIIPKTTESTSGITEADVGWNFLQCNNIKLLPSVTSVEEARGQYINELKIPTKEIISGILYRYESKIILYGSTKGNDISLYSLDLEAQGNITKIFTYFGSDILYSEFPFVYYLESGNNFLTDGSTVYHKLVRLNIDTLSYTKTDISATKYIIRKTNALWHLYFDIEINGYLLKRDDKPNSLNLTIALGILGKTIVDFIVLNLYDVYIIADKQVYYINVQTLDTKQIATTGEPIKFLFFTSSIGAVLTYTNGYVQIEDIQSLKWPSKPSDWHTPLDLKPGNILKPYRLYLNILHKRLSPIFKLYDNIIMERVGGTTWEYEFTLPIKYRQLDSACAHANIRIGIPYNSNMAMVERTMGTNISSITSVVETSLTSSVSNSLDNEKRLQLNHDTNSLPCDLQKGFKIYEI